MLGANNEVADRALGRTFLPGPSPFVGPILWRVDKEILHQLLIIPVLVFR